MTILKIIIIVAILMIFIILIVIVVIVAIGYCPPPLTNSWTIILIGLYIALYMTPNIGCYWEGAVPNLNPVNPKP